MPRWTREPDADQRIELAIASFKIGFYKSREDAAKSHGVDPNTLRRRLNGKHKSHKVAHTHQQRLLPPAESAVVRQCIYLANAGFPARIRKIRVIATKILILPRIRPDDTSVIKSGGCESSEVAKKYALVGVLVDAIYVGI